MAHRTIVARLIHAAEWFATALHARLEARGWPGLSRNQLLAVTLLAGTDATLGKIDVARALGITRQSTHTLTEHLVSLGVLSAEADPADRRRIILRLTARGAALADDARAILNDLEAELSRRIGATAVTRLAAVLAGPWGPPPT